MPQPIDMGPQSEASMVTTAFAMKVTFEHKCLDEMDTGVEPIPQKLEIYYPINGGVWIPMFPQCAHCDVQLRIEDKERVAVR